MSSIQIAGIVGITTGGLESESLQQIYNNLEYLSVLSIGSVLPPVFIAYQLRMAGYQSWYMLIITWFTFALSIPTLVMSTHLQDNSSMLTPPQEIRYPGCGSISPISYCLSHDDDFPLTYADFTTSVDNLFPLVCFACCIPVLLWLTLDQLKVQRTGPLLRLRERSRTWSRRMRKTLGVLEMTLRILALIFLFYAWYAYITAVQTANFTSSTYAGPVSTDWSFGQVVAITVWTAPLVQYLYLEIRKYCLSLPGQKTR